MLAAEGVGAPVVTELRSGQSAGFALVRRVWSSSHVGPLVATTASAAEWLFDAVVAHLAGEELSLDLHPSALLTPARLAERGFSQGRSLTRMRRGLPTGATLGPFIGLSAGPQFG
jgi:hypothetical protein